MLITLNAEPVEVPDHTTVADLLPVDPRGLAVAVNGTVIRRDDHARHVLAARDRVEIVTAVQGG